MPKLWRVPIPMVRITAPQLTAIQKLRSWGFGADSNAGDDIGTSQRLQASPTRLVTCIMIVTGLYVVDAQEELRQVAMPDRPQPRACRRMVEHSHHARRAAWADEVRRLSEKPGHRAQHAGQAADSAGQVRAPRASSLQ